MVAQVERDLAVRPGAVGDQRACQVVGARGQRPPGRHAVAVHQRRLARRHDVRQAVEDVAEVPDPGAQRVGHRVLPPGVVIDCRRWSMASLFDGGILRRRIDRPDRTAVPAAESCRSKPMNQVAGTQNGTSGCGAPSASGRARPSAYDAVHQPSQRLRPGRRRHRFSKPLHGRRSGRSATPPECPTRSAGGRSRSACRPTCPDRVRVTAPHALMRQRAAIGQARPEHQRIEQIAFQPDEGRNGS